MKAFKNWVYIYEPDMKGSFDNTAPHKYLLESDRSITLREFRDILFQACEIERIYQGNIWVEISIEKNGVRFASNEYDLIVDMKLTQELTPYINWDMCPHIPPIYKIDRKKSTINRRYFI